MMHSDKMIAEAQRRLAKLVASVIELRKEIALSHEKIDQLKRELSTVKRDRDHWHEDAIRRGNKLFEATGRYS